MNELGTPREILDWDPGDAVFISNSLLDLLHDLGSAHHLSAAFLSVLNVAGLGMTRNV